MFRRLFNWRECQAVWARTRSDGGTARFVLLEVSLILSLLARFQNVLIFGGAICVFGTGSSNSGGPASR